jgi:hypothetical protein
LDPRYKLVAMVARVAIEDKQSNLGTKLVLRLESCNHFRCNYHHSWDTEQKRQEVECTRGGEVAEGLNWMERRAD